jgi:hypothetical protein
MNSALYQIILQENVRPEAEVQLQNTQWNLPENG